MKNHYGYFGRLEWNEPLSFPICLLLAQVDADVFLSVINIISRSLDP